MDLSSAAWKEYWQHDRYPSPAPTYVCRPEYGSNTEPHSSLWCASLLAPMKKRLDERIVVLDWGCGDGRLFDFLARHYQDFKYHGLERSGAFGELCLARARTWFGRDARANFGLMDSFQEAEAVAEADFVVLGSVLTHIPIEQYKDLFDRILPVLGKSGVLASIFVTESYQLMGPGIYGHADCYAAVGITRDQLDVFCRDTSVKYTYTGDFHSLDGNEHRILHFRKSAGTRGR